jgi:hypothetical protein
MTSSTNTTVSVPNSILLQNYPKYLTWYSGPWGNNLEPPVIPQADEMLVWSFGWRQKFQTSAATRLNRKSVEPSP